MEFQSVEEFLRYPFWDEGTVGRLYTKFGMVGIRQARFTIEEVTKQGSQHTHSPSCAKSKEKRFTTGYENMSLRGYCCKRRAAQCRG